MESIVLNKRQPFKSNASRYEEALCSLALTRRDLFKKYKDKDFNYLLIDANPFSPYDEKGLKDIDDALDVLAFMGIPLEIHKSRDGVYKLKGKHCSGRDIYIATIYDISNTLDELNLEIENPDKFYQDFFNKN